MTKTTQQRGICQCCGRQQAVLASGLMSKHGYTVDDGWFNGVCTGQDFKPMQHDITQTGVVCSMVQGQVDDLLHRAGLIESGEITPTTVNTGMMVRTPEGGFVAEVLPWDKANAYQQKREVQSMVWGMRNRANAGAAWIAQMQALAAKYHGQALMEVKKDATAPEAITIGEVRIYKGRTVKASSVSGGKVKVILGAGFNTEITTRMWRTLAKA